MEHLNLIVTVLGGLILLLGLVSKRLEAGPIPPSVLALALGVLIGPQGIGLIDLAAIGQPERILEGAARLTLGIGLVGVALRVPRGFPRRHWGEMTVLILLAMALMWAVSTALVYLILGLPFWVAALIGAIVTATDPIAATPIASGQLAEANVPERIRNAVSFESGANDGLSYLFVFLPFLLLTRPQHEALSHWVTHTLLWEVGAATVFGLLLGYVAGKALQLAERHGTIEQKWRLAYTVALALFAVGAGRLIKTDELLIVFAAGAAFVQVVSGEDRANEEQGQEALNRFFSIPFFALFGMVIPWGEWAKLGWSGVLLAVAILLLRRPLPMLLLKPVLPSIRSRADALFTGWFGPIAVAAVYYATLMDHKLGDPLVWPVVSLVVFASALAHGISASPLTRLYGRHARGKTAESEDSAS
ncbi:cation:proton antiporter [Lysobacter korlensis]|uniref:Cation:proton antiporter n=1 Tax=Lysobacter korlensis TaxID=553636 RepID=A0ABV6RK29_9GAMM